MRVQFIKCSINYYSQKECWTKKSWIIIAPTHIWTEIKWTIPEVIFLGWYFFYLIMTYLLQTYFSHEYISKTDIVYNSYPTLHQHFIKIAINVNFFSTQLHQYCIFYSPEDIRIDMSFFRKALNVCLLSVSLPVHFNAPHCLSSPFCSSLLRLYVLLYWLTLSALCFEVTKKTSGFFHPNITPFVTEGLDGVVPQNNSRNVTSHSERPASDCK